MQEVINFLNRHKSGFLATVENNMPRVRPWSFLLEEGGKFWFLTTSQKKVFKQLKENPYIEFCSSSIDYVHLRLTGKIEFCDDSEIKKRIFEDHPMLKNLYQTYENPVLEMFCLKHGTAALNFYHTGEIRFFEF